MIIMLSVPQRHRQIAVENILLISASNSVSLKSSSCYQPVGLTVSLMFFKYNEMYYQLQAAERILYYIPFSIK